MVRQIPIQILFIIFSCAVSCSGQSLRSTLKVPPARIKGRITVDEVVGREPQTTPITKLTIHLFRADDSRQLVELQEGCRRAVKDPNADPLRAFELCSANLRRVLALVPTLPAVATAETDRDGTYEFADVPAAGRYYVVGVKPVEGAEPLAMVGFTNRIQPGALITLNLSANDPWTQAKTPRSTEH